MKLWKVAPLDKAEARRIQTEYNLPAITAILMQIRHMTTGEEIEDFLYNESFIAPPDDIKDMDKAAARVRQAIESNERICVYGDYDADGVTSTALLYSYLEASGANVIYYIPSRETEGYGMNKNAVKTLSERGVKLIVTVDNGIAANEEIDYAASLGIETVVTDHHTPLKTIPNAVAVVDLHRQDCPSRFKQLSGVGVAFKLVMALEGEYCDCDALLDNYADLLSLGTIGDIVDLRGENRVFVKRGLQSLLHTDRVGIAALIHASGLEGRELTAGRVSFTLVPRINAVGRLGESGKSVDLLLTEDDVAAREIAQAMDEDNTERRRIENDILEKIDEIILQNPGLTLDRVMVIDGRDWHQGVIGIVASRIKEIYGKPVIIISDNGQSAKASGRSIAGFPLCDAVAYCADLLTHYGGHPMAVGLSLASANISLFRKRINEFAAAYADMPFDTLNIACKLNPASLTVEMADALSLLQPYGAGNPTPVFGFSNMTIADIIPLSNNKHVKLQLKRQNTRMSAMMFFTASEDFPYRCGDVIDIAATLDINEYGGSRSVSVIVKDVKASGEDTEAMLRSFRVYEEFCRGSVQDKAALRALLPDREDFALVYRYLRDNGGYAHKPETLVHALDNRLSYGKIRVVLEALSDLRLIEIREGLKRSQITLTHYSGKADLSSARIIQAIQNCLNG